MGYVVEAGASRRMRRFRAFVTLGVVALMLFFAFWYAYSYYRAAEEKRNAPLPPCPTSTAVSASDVTVNVYNATDRNGLAAKTAGEVRKRGFRVATVSNDPLKKAVPGAAEVRYGPSGAAAGKLVLALVKGAKAVPDSRPDGTVDLVVGEKFAALAPPVKTATATSSTTTAACRPATTG